MENLATSAPPTEAQLKTPLQQVEAYSERYLELKRRKDRSLVKTRAGLRIGDPDIRKEWAVVEDAMDYYLELLFEENVKLGLDNCPESTENGQVDVQPTQHSTVRFQMPHEPIPEFHDEYIVIIDDEDLGRGRKYDV